MKVRTPLASVAFLLGCRADSCRVIQNRFLYVYSALVALLVAVPLIAAHATQVEVTWTASADGGFGPGTISGSFGLFEVPDGGVASFSLPVDGSLFMTSSGFMTSFPSSPGLNVTKAIIEGGEAKLNIDGEEAWLSNRVGADPVMTQSWNPGVSTFGGHLCNDYCQMLLGANETSRTNSVVIGDMGGGRTSSFGQVVYEVNVIASVPEPSSFALLGSALLGMALLGRRSRRLEAPGEARERAKGASRDTV